MEPPRRNIRNEIIVALAAFSMIALAVLFALLLTAPTAEPITGTATGSVTTASVAQTAIGKGSPTASPSEVPTDTPQAQPAETDTPPPTEQASATSTEAAEPASATATNEPTRTPRPSRTPQPSATPTEEPPTATRTPRPSRTPTATIPSTEADTPTSPPTATLTTTAAECVPPAGWQPYTVQSGDNLFRISLRANVSLAEMQTANCIPTASDITAGEVIYVPPFFFANVPTVSSPGTQPPQPTASSDSSLPLRTGCTLPNVLITSPQAGATRTQPFTVYGTAAFDDPGLFGFYKVELLQEGTSIPRNVAQQTIPVIDGALATINPADFAPGYYQIILTVVDSSGNFPQPCAIRVYFP